jgi:hypothetical protein
MPLRMKPMRDDPKLLEALRLAKGARQDMD